ncbi:tRNA1(Val) (adenine(37)-N6)-methyltransferase [Ferviditalea candida]|uniref:tRNA1(Val) (Adenine(37)-N6)-methyltransferase n=1 Tax=Ferviditalea candida TaxID=3108399 RepID=A0ABU5ZJN0_9BACL|nr:tRNA1(Val) (adenine(37)-N6)-methyltransferase [Paenibacillaceae bacterium T2]
MTQVELRENERIDDLLTRQLKIIQSPEVFSFSMDAVLLARFCSVPAKGKILDMCTGNGVIPLLLSTRTKAHISGIEIQERLYDMAVRSVRLNGLERQLEMLHGDLRDLHKQTGYGSFDAITVNPPYLPVNAGEQNVNEYVAIARHEIFATLEEVIAAAARLVKPGGKVAMVHRPSRVTEILTLLRDYRLEPKRIRFVHPRAEQEANMVLIETIRDGRPEVRLLPPLIVYRNETEYCQELMDIYYGQKDRLIENGGGQDEHTEKLCPNPI